MEMYNKNRHRLLGGLVGMALAMLTTPAMALITGSAHDFSGDTAWNGTGEICAVCHTPHNAPEAAVGPLWNHTLSTQTYTVYTSPTGTLDGTAANPPSGASKLCLSCHDGTVALDSFGGNSAAGANILIGAVNANADFGTDLSDDHPISISYTADTSLNPTTTAVTIGDTNTLDGTIGSLLVPGGTVECSSCHDVHNTYAVSTSIKLLKISNAASALCLTCHAK